VHDKILVRRLTPLECGRLQGFPAGYTQIEVTEVKTRKKVPRIIKKAATDSQQYQAYGNSMTTKVMRWLGERIDMVEEAQGFIEII
jgi:DNA (cytosine-5)-methyltransferase 1